MGVLYSVWHIIRGISKTHVFQMYFLHIFLKVVMCITAFHIYHTYVSMILAVKRLNMYILKGWTCTFKSGNSNWMCLNSESKTEESQPPHPFPKFVGTCTYACTRISKWPPFVVIKGNDDTLMYGRRVIFYHPFWGIFLRFLNFYIYPLRNNRILPPYARTIFKKLTTMENILPSYMY
jgi:hypothetical protein